MEDKKVLFVACYLGTIMTEPQLAYRVATTLWKRDKESARILLFIFQKWNWGLKILCWIWDISDSPLSIFFYGHRLRSMTRNFLWTWFQDCQESFHQYIQCFDLLWTWTCDYNQEISQITDQPMALRCRNIRTMQTKTHIGKQESCKQRHIGKQKSNCSRVTSSLFFSKMLAKLEWS